MMLFCLNEVYELQGEYSSSVVCLKNIIIDNLLKTFYVKLEHISKALHFLKVI